jgi:hypothetical protein
MTQQEANILSNMQSQIVQLGQQVQQLDMRHNSLTAGKTTFQNSFRSIQQSLNTVNQEVSRQLSQKVS